MSDKRRDHLMLAVLCVGRILYAHVHPDASDSRIAQNMCSIAYKHRLKVRNASGLKPMYYFYRINMCHA